MHCHRNSVTVIRHRNSNGVAQATSFDPISRLASLTNDLAGTINDLSQTLAYNPASQIASTVRTGDAYAWTGHFNQNVTGTPNGLNQLTGVGTKSLTHDARGNVTAFDSGDSALNAPISDLPRAIAASRYAKSPLGRFSCPTAHQIG